MARFADVVGFAQSLETPPGSGIWEDQITERSYRGDVVRAARKLSEGEDVIQNVSVQNAISIVADETATGHFFEIRYVRWMGVRWTVTKVELRGPRLILSLGEVYNGPTP